MKQIPAFALASIGLLFAAPSTASSQVATPSAPQGEQASSAPGPGSAMRLEVVVTDKSGAPVSGLKAGDFKLLDNRQPQTLISVEPANGMRTDPPAEAILVVDAVNTSFTVVASERQWLASYFKENGGELPIPTSLAIFTDKGIMAQDAPSRDGKVLMNLLDSNASGLRTISRSQGYWGGTERSELSLRTLDDFALNAGKRPGRKLLIWIGPGWPTFPQQTFEMSEKQSLAVFGLITELSTALRGADVTLYSIDPLGVGRNQFYYQEYLKGADAPRHVNYGDLMLPVLATQSGGEVLFGDNDVASLIERCVAEAKAYYVLTYVPPPADHANEYHTIVVQVGTPGLKVRTRTGYYAEPASAASLSGPKIVPKDLYGPK